MNQRNVQKRQLNSVWAVQTLKPICAFLTLMTVFLPHIFHIYWTIFAFPYLPANLFPYLFTSQALPILPLKIFGSSYGGNWCFYMLKVLQKGPNFCKPYQPETSLKSERKKHIPPPLKVVLVAHIKFVKFKFLKFNFCRIVNFVMLLGHPQRGGLYRSARLLSVVVCLWS